MTLSPRTQRTIALCALFLVVAGAAATAVRAIVGERDAVAATGPVAAVRQFLDDTVVNGDGFAGCRYLTAAEQGRVARRAASPTSCGAALADANLRLGGETFTTSRAIDDDLTLTATSRGGLVHVQLSHAGHRARLTLVPSTAAERNDFGAPTAAWRIDRGVDRLVPALHP